MVVVIVMGVCGCGKTTIGEALAQRMGCPFRDADDFHSQANKNKMASSIPLTDHDRLPWLVSIHQYIKSVDESESAVVTCSALKRHYRDILRSGSPPATNNTDTPTTASLSGHPHSPTNPNPPLSESRPSPATNHSAEEDANTRVSSSQQPPTSVPHPPSSSSSDPSSSHPELALQQPPPPPSSSASSSSPPDILFVLLKGSRRVLAARLTARTGHFMSPDLLDSQLDILEVPGDDEKSLAVDVESDVADIVEAIVQGVGRHSEGC